MGMIEVIQVEFWDGTKFIARTDRADCHEMLRKVSLEKREQFEVLSDKDKERLKRNSLIILGGLSRRMLKVIEEELYNKIKMKG